MAGTIVVRGQQSQRFLQRFQPHRQFVLEIDPFSHGRDVARVDGTRQTMLPAHVGRRWLAPTPGIHAIGGKAAEGQAREAAFDQMFGPEPTDGHIVGAEVGDPRGRIIPDAAALIPTVGSLILQAVLMTF